MFMRNVPPAHWSADSGMGRIPVRRREMDGKGRNAIALALVKELQPRVLQFMWLIDRSDR
jgi:hypothetical protein